jgi:hypothetical protein
MPDSHNSVYTIHNRHLSQYSYAAITQNTPGKSREAPKMELRGIARHTTDLDELTE